MPALLCRMSEVPVSASLSRHQVKKIATSFLLSHLLLDHISKIPVPPHHDRNKNIMKISYDTDHNDQKVSPKFDPVDTY